MKTQIIRITGPDGVGKSTTCLDLINYFESKGYKCSYLKVYDDDAKNIYSPDQLDSLEDTVREDFFINLARKQIEAAKILKEKGFIVFLDGSWERSYTFSVGRKTLTQEYLTNLYKGLGEECENVIDMTFFLSTSVISAQERMAARNRLSKLDQCALDNHADILASFFVLKDRYNWYHIDTEELDSKRIINIISTILENSKNPSAADYLGQLVDVIVDRPLGSLHPKHQFNYMVNYGYIKNSLGLDGEELDAYILGVDTPIESFQGICIAVIHRINDSDDKLIVVPDGITLSDDEVRTLTHFQEKYFESEIIR